MHHPDLSPGFAPESVHVLRDKKSGLEGVIVLHSTRLGPAAGGCRLWRYPSIETATNDAMRLAEGMSYKNAMAGLPLGGGKAVIREPEGYYNRAELFAAFGREVEKLNGNYVTAEDVGTKVSDMSVVRKHSSHVAGLELKPGSPGGDPSPWTALGVFLSMQAAVRRKLGIDLSGVTVAVQGLGNVGTHLCSLLHDVGAKLVVADVRGQSATAATERFGAKVLSPDDILEAECDVLAPCALGAVFDDETTEQVRAKIICGGANNVLATPEIGARLAERDILYCPDYVVNSGGIINVCAEYLGWTQEEVEDRVHETGQRLLAVLDHAEASGLAPHLAADALAQARILGHEPASSKAA